MRPYSEEALDALLSRLIYQRNDGEFRWIAGPHGGKRAGRITTHGYRQISFRHKSASLTVHAHVLVFYAENGVIPRKDIDHIDRNKLNNRHTNLREATRSENCINATAKRTNKLGIRGVTERANGKYRAIVTCRGQRHDCGLFLTVSEAQAAYLARATELFGGYVPKPGG